MKKGIKIILNIFFIILICIGFISSLYIVLDYYYDIGEYIDDGIREVITEKGYVGKLERVIYENKDSEITNYIYDKCKDKYDYRYVECIHAEIEKKFEFQTTEMEPIKEVDGKWVGDCETYVITNSILLNKKEIYYSKIILNRHVYLMVYLNDKFCSLDIGSIECYNYD